MKRITLMIVGLLFATMSFAQYRPQNEQTFDNTYRLAKTAAKSGVIIGSVGAAAWLGGNVICMIEQNRYTNSHLTSGSFQEIYDLNQEAKQQPGYKRGEVMETAGFAVLLAGGGLAWLSSRRMKKIENASGEVVAMLSCETNSSGFGVSLNF